MTDKHILNVVTFLGDWTSTLLLECRRKARHLPAFLLVNDFRSYWKYYKELMPYLRQYGDQTGDAGMIRLMNEYCRDNLQGIESAIHSKSGYCPFNCFDPELPYKGMAEFELALTNVMTNLGDLIDELNMRIIILSVTATQV